MGYVTKTVTESVGGVAKTTSHMFETLEDFLRWEGSQVSDQEGEGQALNQGGENEVEVTSFNEDGYVNASNGKEGWWMRGGELE